MILLPRSLERMRRSLTSTQLQILGQASATAASAIFVYFHFFRAADGKQYTEVRDQKRRLILAQMSQILKWKEEDNDSKAKKDGEEKKPPAPQELFDLVFDAAAGELRSPGCACGT